MNTASILLLAIAIGVVAAYPWSSSSHNGRYYRVNSHSGYGGGSYSAGHHASYVQKSWGSWGYWSACSRYCGGGVQTRSRSCESKTVYGYGKSHSGCYGASSASRKCNTQCCAVDGNWGSWSAWSKTSSGYGSYSYKEDRQRSCDYPAPYCGGKDCYGESRQTRERSHPRPTYKSRNSYSYGGKSHGYGRY